ncbi:C40 family peptidase [Alicyclobacillus dauci]|uniref:Permuted papain-like amidase enzyme, YaeF/YiiX, C92 family n=1 Tax=Alicyclobacillus dauci TaxID=1475485 RepID=A0ABY6Z608_9BACL|nr:hypothetical protein [Alicyclobacillus dauci]WAH37709.1 hypothetical protein NZD86_04145 [Alicyclobacillus dauci]
MDVKLADLIFIKGDGFFSRVIERIEHSPYSHVAGVVKPNELVESIAFRPIGYGGVDTYDGVADVFTCNQLTDAQRQAVVNFVIERIGTGYDYPIIGWELFHYEFHIDLPYREDGKDFDCSELWRVAYKSVGIDLCPGLEYASPGDMVLSPLLRKVGSLSRTG